VNYSRSHDFKLYPTFLPYSLSRTFFPSLIITLPLSTCLFLLFLLPILLFSQVVSAKMIFFFKLSRLFFIFRGIPPAPCDLLLIFLSVRQSASDCPSPLIPFLALHAFHQLIKNLLQGSHTTLSLSRRAFHSVRYGEATPSVLSRQIGLLFPA